MTKGSKKVFKISIVFVLLTTMLHAQTYQWAKNMGGIGGERGYSVKPDAFGNVYATGLFTDTADFDPGIDTFNLVAANVYNIFVSKLDANGNFIWAKAISGTDSVYGSIGRSIEVDAIGNVYVTGWFADTADFDPGAGIFNLITNGKEDIFICKLDSNGNFVWAKSFGGTNTDHANGIALDANANVYATGYFANSADFDTGAGVFTITATGNTDIFVIKLDSSGNFIWAKAMGGTASDESYAITLDANANVYTTGSFPGTADFDPGAGNYNLTSMGNADVFISKLDSNGNFIMAKAMGGSDSDYGYSIAVDTSGNIYSTGTFYNTVDFDPGIGTYNLTSEGATDIFISKISASGNFILAKSIGESGFDNCYSLALDAANNIYTLGIFLNTVDFDPGIGIYNVTSAGGTDIFMSKLDSSGNFLWARTMTGVGYDYGTSMSLDGGGSIYVTGSFNSLIDFDPPLGIYLTATGPSDIFVAKYSPTGVGQSNYLLANTFSVYPNPSNGILKIDLGEQFPLVDVEITNMIGQQVNEKHFNNTSFLNLQIDGESGLYFVRITLGNNKIVSLKVVRD
jgi:Secretion system C-terminal sorting domain/Beta-propeller repeat